MGLLRKLLNRLCNLLNTTPVQEPQPHPGQVNETPVRACEVHGDSEAKREKSTRKRKRFWRWHSRRKMYSVAKTERQNLTHVAGTGTYRRHSQSIKEVVPIAEYQLEQEVLQPAVLDSPGHSSADNDTDAPVPLSADGRFDSAVSLSVDQDINSAVSPKAERDVACAISTKVDGDVACAVSPKVDGDVACAVSTKVHKGIDSAGHAKKYKGIASAGRPKVDRGIASAVCTQVDGITNSVPAGELDKDHICCRYKFGGRLGEGGFGSVRKGICLKDGLKVAVKYVRKTKRTTYITTAFHPKPLPLEIALAVIVNREPNCQCIIKLLDWQDDPDHYLIVMERLVPSMDMRTFLKCSGGILREQTAQYIMWQIIYAANFCCNRGIFHRDIKLANLIVNPTTLEIKLIDFGCGDLIKDSGYSTYSGTKPYFPPEYHDRGRYHAKPATVFSLGVLLFGMLHGRFPTAKDLHCLGNNRSVFAVSKECILFLWACLQRHPERRILLEQMLYDDWFVLGFPNGLPYNRNASNQHSHHR
uniref:non-specific serine/threonine protein kinase n=1 Tax=Cyprinus carpio TaxID=7962 RepID=A0A8C1XM31_CYPCA